MVGDCFIFFTLFLFITSFYHIYTIWTQNISVWNASFEICYLHNHHLTAQCPTAAVVFKQKSIWISRHWPSLRIFCCFVVKGKISIFFLLAGQPNSFVGYRIHLYLKHPSNLLLWGKGKIIVALHCSFLLELYLWIIYEFSKN